MRAVIDISGQRFGRWTAIRLSHVDSGGHAFLVCRCDCLNEKVVRDQSLIRGQSQSCGCLRREVTARRNEQISTTHGHTSNRVGRRSPTYNSWQAMIKRCEDPKCNSYERYGGRGITVCERWRWSFENFLADMGERPIGMTLDRIDNDGNYEPGNCRWTTPKEQQRKRVSH